MDPRFFKVSKKEMVYIISTQVLFITILYLVISNNIVEVGSFIPLFEAYW